MKDYRNEYTLDLIQQMYNILVLRMSSRTLSILLWPFLALSVQVHDNFSHLSCLTPGGRPPWMLRGLVYKTLLKLNHIKVYILTKARFCVCTKVFRYKYICIKACIRQSRTCAKIPLYIPVRGRLCVRASPPSLLPEITIYGAYNA